ncbi:MAG: PorV/PorQ family protein [Bacteroidetes bacterium]|nr:PorV/PorQ family protein [Bacteroidota bacterium]
MAVLSLSVLPSSFVFAQEGASQLGGGIDQPNTNRAGTSGAAELLVPLTARYSALGGATTSVLAGMNGLEALYANPAGLTNNQSTSALFSRLQYVADIGVNYFGLAQRFGDNNLALTIAAWDMGELYRQTEANPEKSDDATFRVSFINVGLTYARTLTDRISAGATIKVVNESIDDLTATGIIFDAGMTYVVGESGLRLGVALKNVGNELQFSGTGLGRQVQLPDQQRDASVNTVQLESEGVQYPTLLNFGVAYERSITSNSSVTLLGNFRSNSFEDDDFSGAVELGYGNLLYLRGGYEYSRENNVTFYKGYSFGAGLQFQVAGTDLAIDYSLLPTDYFDNIQFITASVQL